MNKDKTENIAKRLLTSVSGVKYGTVSVSLKVHEGGIVETSYTVSECTKEKEPKRVVNSELGRSTRGPLDIHHEILS